MTDDIIRTRFSPLVSINAAVTVPCQVIWIGLTPAPFTLQPADCALIGALLLALLCPNWGFKALLVFFLIFVGSFVRQFRQNFGPFLPWVLAHFSVPYHPPRAVGCTLLWLSADWVLIGCLQSDVFMFFSPMRVFRPAACSWPWRPR